MPMFNIELPEFIEVPLGRGLKTVKLSTTKLFEANQLGKVAEHGMPEKFRDSFSDLKAESFANSEALALAREARVITCYNNILAGNWRLEREGKTNDPVAKHARLIALDHAKRAFDGLTFTSNNGIKLKKGSKAEETIAAFSQVEKLPVKTDEDIKKLFKLWVEKRAELPKIRELAEQRAKEDEELDLA